jgi:retron-type reverse transcriptase
MLGIRAKHLFGKILRMLKAPVKMPNGELKYPTKGTPQGGIISPLLANMVLNELDKWVESNWKEILSLLNTSAYAQTENLINTMATEQCAKQS